MLRVFLLALVLAIPVAAADETLAECEDGQAWIGYRSTDAARTAVQPTLEGAGLFLAACEGEQWDGQDSIAPGESARCTPALDPELPDARAAWCLGSDPNSRDARDVTNPLGVRASSEDLREAYLSSMVAFVGHVAVYSGVCAAGAGLEGEERCRGTLELRQAVYVRDGSSFDLVAYLIGGCLFSVIPECAGMATDCTQAQYEHGIYSGSPTCRRDNTAIAVMLVV